MAVLLKMNLGYGRNKMSNLVLELRYGRNKMENVRNKMSKGTRRDLSDAAKEGGVMVANVILI